MKYYESHFEEYISAVETYNIHPELVPIFQAFPPKLDSIKNIIIYGPTGTGKYSQVLTLLKKYSPSKLKYERKIMANTEKQDYIYRISDIHYEIDMSLLGCNSKLVWHEIFLQIIDIISVKPDKTGVLVCKNFHLIHSELLDVFYSYMQHYTHENSSLKIIFCIVTEHLSFLPSPIIRACHTVKVKRPSKQCYMDLCNLYFCNDSTATFSQKISNMRTVKIPTQTQTRPEVKDLFQHMEPEWLINIKELHSFSSIETLSNFPKDIFNMICDNIIKKIMDPKSIQFAEFRDTIYDILTYNLDMTECLWHILKCLIESQNLSTEDASDILRKSYSFLKYYNNNYRPIYHLESMMFYIINKIHGFQEKRNES
jgi:hypothetical protein